MNRRLITGFIAAICLAGTAHAQLSVTLIRNPDLPAAEVGELITIEALADFTSEATLGGGINVFFSDLTPYDSINPSNVGDPAFYRLPDIMPNVLNGWAAGDFSCLPSAFTMGSVSFTAIASGNAQFNASDNIDPAGLWVGCNTFAPQIVNYTGASVAIFDAVDSDGDGLNDAPEVNQGSDPMDPDSDNDGRGDATDPNPLTAPPNFCTGDNALAGPYIVINAEVIDCRAQISITSNGDFIVEPGGETLFMSQQIGLDPGFQIQTGGTFIGVIATDIAN